MSNVYENKEEYVRKLCAFYQETDPAFQITEMEYKVDSCGNEWVEVQFISGAKKRFCVNCDSNRAIFLDFAKFIKNFREYEWMP